MTESSDTVVVMQGPHTDLERFAERLADHGIEAAIIRPDESSGSS